MSSTTAEDVTSANAEEEDGGGGVPDGMHPLGDDDALLRDYLYKMTRDGRWQRRWFETNGIFLTYYKSRKREKLLAALSLLQVGEIKSIVPPDDADLNNREGWFTIQLNSRIYTLRARSNAEADKWVNGLIEIKNANPDTGSTISPMKNMVHNPSSAPIETAAPTGWQKRSKSGGFLCC